MIMKFFLTLLVVVATCSAFVVEPRSTRCTTTQLFANQPPLWQTATATLVLTTTPLVAIAAEQVDDYEYGAVNAPIGTDVCVCAL
jgi:hypothetical protein